MYGRITCQLKACTEDQKGTRVGPTKFCCDQVLLRAHTCLFQKKPHSFMVAPKDQRLYGVGRRTAAVSIHMCVWQNHMSTQGLHQGSKKHKSLADQLLLRAYTYVCCRKKGVEPEDQGLPGLWQTKCCIHMCASEKQFKVAPKGQRLHGIGRPTAAASIHMCVAGYICCVNTHVCPRVNKLRVARKNLGIKKGFGADQLLL